MKQPLFFKYVWPFFLWFALMIIVAIGIDYILHYFQWVYVGRYLGIIGTITIGISFIYSARKRKMITSGSPKQLLLFHEYLSWIGSIMLLVHAGIHFNAILPWLAIVMLLITVGSGLVGKYLLKKSSETLKEKRQILISTGTIPEEADKILFFDSITVDLMKQWRVIHLPITLILAVLSVIHIVSILMYSK